MKLRNKKTGGIDDFKIEATGLEWLGYTSLKEFCEEWEDVPEEPKEWWYIDIHGPHKVANNDEYYQQVKAASKEIGNYFESPEEAELALRKLKAWKRLKNCGFKFIDWWLSKDNHIIIGTNMQIFDINEQGLQEELDLLFSGEDD